MCYDCGWLLALFAHSLAAGGVQGTETQARPSSSCNMIFFIFHARLIVLSIVSFKALELLMIVLQQICTNVFSAENCIFHQYLPVSQSGPHLSMSTCFPIRPRFVNVNLCPDQASICQCQPCPDQALICQCQPISRSSLDLKCQPASWSGLDLSMSTCVLIKARYVSVNLCPNQALIYQCQTVSWSDIYQCQACIWFNDPQVTAPKI